MAKKHIIGSVVLIMLLVAAVAVYFGEQLRSPDLSACPEMAPKVMAPGSGITTVDYAFDYKDDRKLIGASNYAFVGKVINGHFRGKSLKRVVSAEGIESALKRKFNDMQVGG